MKTMNIFKTLALAMLMPAMLLTTACSSEDDLTNNTVNSQSVAKKGYALPVTVSATREGDKGSNRAAFDGSKLAFTAGDKLFVEGQHSTAGQFAGTLDYDAVSKKFSGTIYTQNEWTGTADALFTESSEGGVGYYAGATLLPDGYGSTGFLFIATNGTEDKYDDRATCDYDQAFALTKAAGVEQLSREEAGYYDKGFVLEPRNAILNFTITGLAASTEVAVVFTESYYSTTINKNVTTDGSGNATFAIGLSNGVDFANCSLSVGGLPITLTSSSKTLEAGKIYNISRNAIPGALIGKFSVSSTKKVYFSKGNLQATYDGSNWTWAFAEHQWDYIGNNAANTAITGNKTVSTNGTVDLFGWSTSTTYNGIHNSTSNIYSGAFVDWGSHSDVIAGIGSGWRTLSMDEWTYLLATRTVNGGKGADKSYTINQSVNGKSGMVVYPDNYTGAVYSGSNWASFEAAGCVFLPAAGWRDGTTIKHSINDRGYYWSTTPSNATAAKRLFFAGGLELTGDNSRAFGFSVRLVYNAN